MGSYESIIELVIALAQANMRMVVNLAESSQRHSGARFLSVSGGRDKLPQRGFREGFQRS